MSQNMFPESPDFPEVPDMPELPNASAVITENNNKDWMAIISLVAGILSLCGSLFAPLGCVMAAAAIVFGILGLRSDKRTLAMIGLVVGGLGIVLSLVFGLIAIFGLLGPSMGNLLEELLPEFEIYY